MMLCEGCLKGQLDIEIRDDSSGNFTLDYSISENSISQIRSMFGMAEIIKKSSGDETLKSPVGKWLSIFADPDKTLLKNSLEELAPYGVTAKQIIVDSRNFQRYVTVNCSFKDIAKFTNTSLCREFNITFSSGNDENFTLSRKVEQSDKSLMSFSKDEIISVTPLLKDFEVVLNVTVPARVMGSNADKVSKNQASWTFDFNKDPDSFLEMINRSIFINFEKK